MLAASLLGSLGTTSVGLIYICFSIAGFFAPTICRRIGARRGLLFGSATYALYVASLVYMVVPVVLLTSALIGVGAGVLWTAQGMIMSENTDNSNKSAYNSLFWGIFNLCVIPGNVSSACPRLNAPVIFQSFIAPGVKLDLAQLWLSSTRSRDTSCSRRMQLNPQLMLDWSVGGQWVQNCMLFSRYVVLLAHVFFF